MNCKKKKKGFTLVELLAVIVVLAIIILIVVNVIIPIINKSRKKALLDEAQVYMNAAMNHRAIDIDSGVTESTCITIAELNSEHVKKHGNNYSGIVNIDYINGELVPYIYLTNGKYYVVGSGKLSLNNVAGEEPSGFKTSCSDAIARLIDEDNDLDISIGDKVIIGDDEFYYIGRDENNITNLKLLAKYNLNSEYRQFTSADQDFYVAISNVPYWAMDDASSSSSSSSSSEKGVGSNDFEPWSDSEYKYFYRNKDDKYSTAGDTNNNLKIYINNYRSHIENDLGVNVVDARLMSYEEAVVNECSSANSYSCPEWMVNQSYWLGSAYDNDDVWYVSAVLHILYYNNYNYDYIGGVRPVIIVSESEVSMPWANNNTLIYSDVDNSGSINLGDSVRIAQDGFRVISEPDASGNVTLLPMYNISFENRQHIEPYDIVFSKTSYWTNSSDFVPWGNSSHKYIYRDKYGNETDNNLKARINSYKNYLDGLNIVDVIDARLMSYEEALYLSGPYDSFPIYASNMDYYLGSIRDDTSVAMIYSDGHQMGYTTRGYLAGHQRGVRPVIVVKASDITSN